MILFKPFGGFDFELLSKFNGIESTKRNLEDLRSRIEDLYFRDDSFDYSTKGGFSWSIIDLQEGAMLEILIDE